MYVRSPAWSLAQSEVPSTKQQCSHQLTRLMGHLRGAPLISWRKLDSPGLCACRAGVQLMGTQGPVGLRHQWAAAVETALCMWPYPASRVLILREEARFLGACRHPEWGEDSPKVQPPLVCLELGRCPVR